MKTSEKWGNLIVCKGKFQLVFWHKQMILSSVFFKLAFNLKMEAKQWKQYYVFDIKRYQ